MNNKTCCNPLCNKSLENINEVYQCEKCNKDCCSNSCLMNHKLTEHPIKFPNSIKSKNRYEDESSENSNSKRSSNTNSISSFNSKNNLSKKGEIIKNFIDNPKYSIINFKFMRNEKNNKILCLHKGKYHEILLAKNIKTDKLYSIKHIIKSNLKDKKNDIINLIQNEINIQKRLIHPNILRLYSFFEDENNYLIVFEYVKKNLYSKIKKEGKLKEETAFNIFIQIISSLYFLHTNNYIHRNIIPENILINDNNEIKLTNFSYCTEIKDKKLTTIIKNKKVEYTSPEMIREQPYNQSIDIWSIGVLLYFILHGYSPFGSIEENVNYDEIIRNIIIDKFKIDPKLNLSNECIDLINKLLEFDCNKRINIKQILIHPWIKKFSKKSENNNFSNVDLMEKINVTNSASLFNKNDLINKFGNDNKILFDGKYDDNILNEYLNTDSNDSKDNIFEKAIKKSHRKKKRNLRNNKIDNNNNNEILIQDEKNDFNLLNEKNINNEKFDYMNNNKNVENDNNNNNININNINIYNSLQIDRKRNKNNPNLFLKSGNFYLGFDTPNPEFELVGNKKMNDLNNRKNLDAIDILESANKQKKEQKKQNKKIVLRDPNNFWDKLFEHFKCGKIEKKDEKI